MIFFVILRFLRFFRFSEIFKILVIFEILVILDILNKNDIHMSSLISNCRVKREGGTDMSLTRETY